MAPAELRDSWEECERLLEEGDLGAVAALLVSLPSDEAPGLLARIDEEERARLMEVLAPDIVARWVEQAPEVQAADLVEHLEPSTAAAVLHELPSDTQADILGDLDSEDAEAILAEMTPAEATSARSLSRYPDDVAGGLMKKEYLSYRQDLSVLDVSQDLQEHARKYRDYQVQYAFVTDAGKLVGVLRLRDLLLAPRDRRLKDLMIPNPQTVSDTAGLDELRGFFDRTQFFGVPVVDRASTLVGIVQRADVEEALAGRTESDYLKSQGIVGGEELRTMPVLLRSRRRLAWLGINIALNVVAASVIAFYEETLAAVIALAVFLPIVSDMSGCSGNQAVAVSMRELSLGFVNPREILRVWGKEMSVGVINGLVLGMAIAAVAWLWKGNPWLGLVVGTALALNTVVSVSIGGTVPLLLRGMKIDPALASGPILTTVTDMCGFFLTLSIAAALLPLLV